MVPTAVPTSLMASLRPLPGAALTAFAAVDLAAVVRLANVEARRAAPAANSQKNDNIHARTERDRVQES